MKKELNVSLFIRSAGFPFFNTLAFFLSSLTCANFGQPYRYDDTTSHKTHRP
jgi:hypothetical protein